MTDSDQNAKLLRELCACQRLAVLATDAGIGPYASLVAIAVTPDLHQIYFATSRATRKWANLTGNHQVALLVDNRSNQDVDFRQGAAATILGIAEELQGDDQAAGEKLYLARHPHLAEFVREPNCALFRVQVTGISLVTGFQKVENFNFSD